jgi:hypothetical protein
MNRGFNALGGARVGWVNASWPLVKLSVSAHRLKLSGFIGTYDFLPHDVVSLESYGWIPFLYRGVRIRHSRLDYPRKLIFWNLGSSEKLIQRIRSIGFLPSGPASSEVPPRGFPWRWGAILAFFAVWSGSSLLTLVFSHSQYLPMIFGTLFLLWAFACSSCIRASPTMQRLVLKHGRSVAEIQAWLLPAQTGSGLILGFSLVLLLVNLLTR